MKRLLIAFVLFLVPSALFAQMADRDVLLTPDGTLYTIESTRNEGSLPPEVMLFLRLTIQRANERQQTIVVPDSVAAGIHSHPALAYDSESKTLFVFWLKMPNPTSSELLLASYRNGTWQSAVSIGSQLFRLRYNLRIGITRRVAQLQGDGSYRDVPALLVHAVWWEETGDGEAARYGFFAIDKGDVSTIELHDLADLVSRPSASFYVDPNFNREILKHPAIIDNGTSDSVDVVFGDFRTNSFNRITLRPIADSRIHIPVGMKPGEGGGRFPAPQAFSAPWTGSISAIAGRDGRLLFYNTTADSVSYMIYADGLWSSVKTVPLNEKLSVDAAVGALNRMMNQ
jgi:hypothetical protein